MFATSSPQDRRQQFREDLRAGLLVAPGVHDALSARIAEAVGARAMFATGAGLSATLLGTPDVGLLTMTEVRDQTRNIVNATSIPVIADCDTGYGNPVNVMRTVQEFEVAGVSGLFIEDQVAPKKCGHFKGKQVVPVAEMSAKLQAAIDGRRDKGLVLIARTDSRAVNGIEDAVERARAYASVGVDMVFVEAPESVQELEYVLTELRDTVPVMVNLVEGGKTPLVPIAQLRRMGVSLLTYSGSGQKAAIKSMTALYKGIVTGAPLEDFFPSQMVSLDERSALLGLPEFYELEQKYV